METESSQSQEDYAEQKQTEILLTDNEPEQSGEHPKWKYPKRRDPKWGEVTKRGLVVGRGENKRVVPPDEVYKLASLGCTNQEIADWFEVNWNTMDYNFKDYIQKGRAQLKQRLRMAQLQAALAGNPTMLVWLGKNILGQTDTPVNAEANQPLPWSND